MKRLVLALLVVLSLSGCFLCSGADHDDLLLENRKHLVEKVWQSYADALQNAKDPDGNHLYIVELRDAQLEVVSSMIVGTDRVLPPEKKWVAPPAPWAEELKALRKKEASDAPEGESE